MKKEYSCYKCAYCIAIFKMSNAVRVNYCPNCGNTNINKQKTVFNETKDAQMLDLNKPVQTKDGIPVKILTRYLMGDYRVLGILENEYYGIWDKYGRSVPELSSDNDLVNVPAKECVVWVDVYQNDGPCVHNTQGLADANAIRSRIARVKVVVEEGRFDT